MNISDNSNPIIALAAKLIVKDGNYVELVECLKSVINSKPEFYDAETIRSELWGVISSSVSQYFIKGEFDDNSNTIMKEYHDWMFELMEIFDNPILEKDEQGFGKLLYLIQKAERQFNK